MRATPAAIAAVPGVALAAPAVAGDPAKHRLLFTEYRKGPNRLVELDADGKVVWEYAFPGISVIFQPLPDGHVLFAHGGTPTGVTEIDRDKKEVWRYVSQCPQVLGGERLPNGNTQVDEQGPCRAVEVDPTVSVVQVSPSVRADGRVRLPSRLAIISPWPIPP